MRLEKVTNKQQMDAIYELYMTAFPKEERKPFALMLEKCQDGSMEMLSIEDEENNFLGLAIFVLYDDLALLDYFAIAEDKRNCGLGSEALTCLQKYYLGKRFFLEIENAKVDAPNQEERRRRRAFYLKNNMTVMPFMVDLFGVEMEILTYQSILTPKEYMSLYIGVFTNKVADKVRILL